MGLFSNMLKKVPDSSSAQSQCSPQLKSDSSGKPGGGGGGGLGASGGCKTGAGPWHCKKYSMDA